MSDIRRANALKLLKKHCNGVIKEFANKLGKNERQCSNFLREKNPHNIGNMIARQIEVAFEYPVGWLDIANEVEQKQIESVGTEYTSLMDSLAVVLSKLNQKIFNSPTLKESMWLHEHLHDMRLKGKALVRENSVSLLTSMTNDFTKFIKREHNIIVKSTSMPRILLSSKCMFRLLPTPISTEREQHSLPDDVLELHKEALLKKEMPLLDVKPFVFNGDLKYLFFSQDVLIVDKEFTNSSGDELSYIMPLVSDCKDEPEAVKSLLSYLDHDTAFIDHAIDINDCHEYINTHPKLEALNKIKQK